VIAWWGTDSTEKECIVVASSRAKAARLVGVKASEFPYRFERTQLPETAAKGGVYRLNAQRQWQRETGVKS
jgi:hypothetical protein